MKSIKFLLLIDFKIFKQVKKILNKHTDNNIQYALDILEHFFSSFINMKLEIQYVKMFFFFIIEMM